MSKPNYPNSSTFPVTENLHGVEMTDHYRWLEDGDSDQIKAWVAEQNAFSPSFLEQCSEREALAAERYLETTAPCTMFDAKRQTLATRGSRNRQQFS